MSLRVVDLFCGIGGFRLAAEALGHECVFACDLDPQVRATYAENFGETPHADILTVAALPDHDVICAGFPCQPYSVCNQRGRKRDRPTATELSPLRQLLNLAEASTTPALVLENVPDLMNAYGGRPFKSMLEELALMGFTVQTAVLNGSHFGAIQSRRRLFIVATRHGWDWREPTPAPTNLVLADVLDPDDDHPELYWREAINWRYDNEVRQPRAVFLGTILGVKNSLGRRVYSKLGHAPTIRTKVGRCGSELYRTADGGARALSLPEVQRLMGFPPDFRVLGGRVAVSRQLGNAVIPMVVQRVLEGLTHGH